MKVTTDDRVSIIIPARRYNSEVELLIDALLKQKKVADEILLVVKEGCLSEPDYGSSVRILLQNGKGPANARNLGAREASGRILIFIDSDCFPADENWLCSLLFGIDNRDVGVTCGRIIIPGSGIISQFIRAMSGLGTPDYGSNAFFIKERFMSFPATNMVIKREVFQRIGGFDEKLIISEDLDFFWRLWNAGITIKYEPKAIMFHRHRVSLFELLRHALNTGKGSINFLQKYGFFNRFLKGTFLSAISILLTPPFLWILIRNIFVCEVIILGFYLVSFLIFYRKREPTTHILTTLSFPILLVLYAVLLGLGVWYALIRRYVSKGS